MTYSRLAAGLVLGGLVLIGCKKEEPAVPTTPPVQTPAVPQTEVPAMPTMPGMPAMPTTAPSVAVANAAADAQSKLDQVMAYIKDKKLDLADSTLKQLEANKASLPASLQSGVEKARTALDAAKAMGGSTPALPGGIGLPK